MNNVDDWARLGGEGGEMMTVRKWQEWGRVIERGSIEDKVGGGARKEVGWLV